MGSKSIYFSTGSKRFISAYLVFALSFTGFLSILLILSPAVSATTYVGGDIDEDTTWDDDGSPYVVTSDIHVLEDITLKIDPGVTIKFNDGKKIVVDGLLYANGTATDQITFTSNNSSPQKGDWYTIRLRTEGNNIEHATIEYASYGIFMTYYGTNNTVTNTTIKNSEIDGVYITNSDGNHLKDIIVKDSDRYGITVYQSDNTIIDNALVTGNNYFGINLNASKYTSISNSNISDNDGIGILFYSNSNHTTLDNVTLYQNQKQGLHLSGSGYNVFNDTKVLENGQDGESAGINLGERAENNVFVQTTVENSGGHGFDLGDSNSTTLINVTSKSNANSGLYSQGYLSALEVVNSTIDNNTEHGIELLHDVNNADISYSKITGNGIDGIYLYTNRYDRTPTDHTASISGVTVENSEISGNDGIGVNFQSIQTSCQYCHSASYKYNTIKNNQISSNEYGIAMGSSFSGHYGNSFIVKYTTISLNTISHNREDGLLIDSHQGLGVMQNNFNNNTITDNGGNGFLIKTKKYYESIYDNNFMNNTISNNGLSGFDIRIYTLGNGWATYFENNDFSGSKINNNSDYGLRIYEFGEGYPGDGCYSCDPTDARMSDITIKDMELIGNDYGLVLASDHKVGRNGIEDTQIDNLTVLDNRISGIIIKNTLSTTLTNSIISNNGPKLTNYKGDIPVAQINSISSHDVVHGTNVTFNGTTTLSNATVFRWNSSIDGTIGSGKLLTIPSDNLSVGHHTIYFYVKDSQGSWTSPAISYVKVSYKVKIDNIEETTHQYNTNFSDYNFYGLWTLDDDLSDGGLARDDSGNDHSGTIGGDVFSVAGKYGNAFSFCCNEDDVQLPKIADGSNDRSNLNNFTVQLWFYIEGEKTYRTLFSNYNDAEFRLTVQDGGDGELYPNIQFRTRDSENVYHHSYLINTNVNFNNNQWYHLAAYFSTDENIVRGYVDGIEFDNETIESDSALEKFDNGNINIGTDAGNNNFKGLLDQVMIVEGHNVLMENFSLTDVIVLNGSVTGSDDIDAYYWNSSLDGQIGSAKDVMVNTSSLSGGLHKITFAVKYDDGSWSDEAEQYLFLGDRNELDTRISDSTPSVIDYTAKDNIVNGLTWIYWDFEDVSSHKANFQGTTSADFSLYLDGAEVVDGLFGKALKFDGSDDVAYTTEIWRYDQYFLDYTYEFFFKTETEKNGTFFALCKEQTEENCGSSSDHDWEIFIMDDGKVGFRHEVTSSSNPLLLSDEAYNDGVWHHLAIVTNWDNNKAYLYMDGMEVDSSSVSWDWEWKYDMYMRVGGSEWPFSDSESYAAYEGLIDSIRISGGGSHNGGSDDIGIFPENFLINEIDFTRLYGDYNSSKNFTEFSWESSIDGTIGNNTSLGINDIELSHGKHSISFKGKLPNGNWTVADYKDIDVIRYPVTTLEIFTIPPEVERGYEIVPSENSTEDVMIYLDFEKVELLENSCSGYSSIYGFLSEHDSDFGGCGKSMYFPGGTIGTIPWTPTKLVDYPFIEPSLGTGVHNNAYDFAGGSSYIVFRELDGPAGGPDELTIEAWIKLTEETRYSSSNNCVPIYSGQNDGEIDIEICDGGTVRAKANIDDEQVVLTSNITIEMFRWYHIAFTYDKSTSIELFIEGNSVAQDDIDGTLDQNTNSDNMVGGIYSCLNWNICGVTLFSGLIDEFRISSVVRNSSTFLLPENIQQWSSFGVTGTVIGNTKVTDTEWISSLDGTLDHRGESLSLSTQLSVGNHTLKIRFMDHHGAWSDFSTTFVNVTENSLGGSGNPQCPLSVHTTGYGIYIEGGSNHLVRYNTIERNSHAGIGIFRWAENSEIQNNNINCNGYFAIEVDTSNNTLISRNTLSNTTLAGLYVKDTSGGSFHHNNFMYNFLSAYDDSNADNEWDDGSEGNYWDDYDGDDDNGDGIGEDPYVIPGGGSRDWKPFMNYQNNDAPRVNWTTPVKDATNVALDTSFTISFTKEMNTTATEDAISITGNVDLEDFSWSNGNTTLSFEADEDLSSRTLYTITVSTSAKDFEDNWVNSPYKFSFTTVDVESPYIVSTVPVDDSTSIAITATIKITFNEEIDTDTLEYSCSPDPGNWTVSWSNGNKIASFTHDPFASKTDYEFEIEEAKDLAGLSLTSGSVANPFSFQSKDIVGPEITSTYPTDDAVNISIAANIVINFNEEIDTDTFTYLISPNPGGWSTTWSNNDKMATLSHDDFDGETDYTFQVTGAEDTAGNDLNPSDVSNPFTFETADVSFPYVTLTSPSNGTTSLDLDTEVVVTFNEAMDTSTVTFSSSPNPGGWSVSWNSGNNVATYTHDDFDEETTYTFNITGGKDLSDNSLTSASVPMPFVFTTGDFTAPKISITTPSNASQGISLSQDLHITFNEEIDTDTFSYTVSPSLGNASVSWNSANTVVSISHDNFNSETTYTVQVTGAKDIAGNQLSSGSVPNPWSFITADVTSPTISSVSPSNNSSSIDLDEGIVITFSEPMNVSSLGYTSSPNPGGWDLSWNNANTVVTFTHSDFDEQTTYTFKITQAEDNSGNDMTSTFVLTFTTGDFTAPTITSTTPANSSTDVLINQNIVITFSEQISTSNFTYTISPSLTNQTASWNSEHTEVTISHSDFASSTTYTVQVTGAKDAVGNQLVSGSVPNPWSFTSADIIGPYISGSSPTNQSTGISTTSSIVITFSEAMNQTSLTYTTNPNPGNWSISWNSGSTIATFSHSDFEENTDYTFKITSARDLSGNNLAGGTYVLAFRTGDFTNPQITAANPESGADTILVSQDIVVTFSEQMDTSNFTYTLTPSISNHSTSWNSGNTVATISHDDFASTTTYTFSVTSAKDTYGNSLTSGSVPNPWNFTTEDIVAPYIMATSPSDDSTDVSTTSDIVFTFSESITNSTFTYTFYPNPGGLSVTWNSGFTIATLHHDELYEMTEYIVKITNAEDLAGNDLYGGTYELEFETGDYTNPYISSINPTSNEVGVPVDQSITVQFSESMNVSSLQLYLIPNPGGVSLSWNSATTVLTIGHNNFSSTTAYTVYIGAITDLYGNELTDGSIPNPWGFTSADIISPELTSFTPEEGSIGVSQDEVVVITFDEYIDSNEFSFSISPNPGWSSIEWNSVNTEVTITFNEFNEDTEYEFQLLNYQDSSGNKGENLPYTSSFKTADTTRPFMVLSNPGNGDQNVDIQSEIKMIFSEPIDVDTFVYVLSPNVIGWNEEWTSDMTMVTLTHDDFDSDTSYILQVLTADDLVGNHLSSEGAPNPFEFTVRDNINPEIVSIYPMESSNVLLDTPIVVTFNEAMEPLSFVYYFDPDPLVTNVVWSEDKHTVTLYHQSFNLNQIYSFTIETVSDTSGNLVIDSGSNSITFTTVDLDTLSIYPLNVNLEVDTTQILIAKAYDSYGNEVEGLQYSWYMDDNYCQIVNEEGKNATIRAGLSVGNCKINVETRGFTASLVANLIPGPVSNVIVIPSSTTINANGTLGLFAYAYDNFDNSIDNTQFIWSVQTEMGSLDRGMGESVTFQSSGVVGIAYVSAMLGDFTGVSVINVGHGEIDSMVIDPEEGVTYSGGVIVYTAKAFDNYGNEIPVTPSWSIEGQGGRFDADGTLLTFERGVWEVTATYGTTIAKTTVVVLPSNIDEDNDKIPSWWEYMYNLDPNDPTDGSMDLDEDGLKNYEEYLNGTDPWNEDTDGDLLSDGFEVIFSGTLPNDMDTNNNGVGDGLEFDSYGGVMRTLDNGHISMTLTWSNYTIFIETNSSVLGASFDKESKKLSITVSGDTDTTGFVNIKLPAELARMNDIDVSLDGAGVEFSVDKVGSYYVIDAEYGHSVHELITSFSQVSGQTSDEGFIDRNASSIMVLIFAAIIVAIGYTYAFRARLGVQHEDNNGVDSESDEQSTNPEIDEQSADIDSNPPSNDER